MQTPPLSAPIDEPIVHEHDQKTVIALNQAISEMAVGLPPLTAKLLKQFAQQKIDHIVMRLAALYQSELKEKALAPE